MPARSASRSPPSPRPLLVLPPHSAPYFPSKRRPSRALAQALAPPQPSPPGESRAAAAGARQALCSSPLPFSLGGRGRGGPRCDCMCVRPGTGSGCGGAGDGEEWGGLGGGCLSGGWQSSAPWRGRRDVPKKGLGGRGGGRHQVKAPRGCLRGAKVFWGQLGSPIDRPLCRLREVLLGAGPWVGRGEVLEEVGGRPEEVAGPELALCLTQGLVHPPSLQLCLLSQSSGGRGPSLPPTPRFSDPCLPVALGN